MNRQIRKALASLNNVRKLSKPTGVCISAILILSTFLVVVSTAVQAQTMPSTALSPLHTSGHRILDVNNNDVYFRGIGRAGDIDSLSGIWAGKGEPVFNYGYKWQTDMATLSRRMDETFTAYRDYWKVNMVRIFVTVDWWWEDNVNPAQRYGQGPNQVMSYRNYIELLVQRAQANGIYVDITPYEVRNHYVSNDQWDGIPGSLGSASLNYMHTINADEMQAWRIWWTSMVDRLGKYSNVIFEMWNEPENAKQPYFDYMIEMYKTIRATGNQNLIFMQWYMGLVPTYHELDWVREFHTQLRNNIGSEPVNVVYTTHPYRHAPYPNLQWKTTYSEVKAQLSTPNMIPATRSNGIDVPLVFNEMGVMADPNSYNDAAWGVYGENSLTTAQRMQNELNFWDAILKNANDFGIGVVSYYWMQTGVWSGWQAMISSPIWDATASSPTPSEAGRIFINSFVAPTPIFNPTPSPTPVVIPAPTPTIAPTPTATPTPILTPIATATPAPPQPPVLMLPPIQGLFPTPTPILEPTQESIHEPTPDVTAKTPSAPSPTATATTAPTPNPTPTPSAQPIRITTNSFRDQIWSIIWWFRYFWWSLYSR